MGYQRASTSQAAGLGSVSPWVAGFSVFAGTVMFITGMFEMFQGLAAIIEDEFFVIGREYAFALDVTTWGWVHLALGAIVAMAGLAVFTGALWARVLGIILAVVVAIANFFTIPYYPIWSMLVIATSILVIWALASYEAAQNDLAGTQR